MHNQASVNLTAQSETQQKKKTIEIWIWVQIFYKFLQIIFNNTIERSYSMTKLVSFHEFMCDSTDEVSKLNININRVKEQNHMINSEDIKSLFDKVQYPFMI